MKYRRATDSYTLTQGSALEMILATLETPNFHFTVLAKDVEHAKRAAQKAWEIHCKQYGADPSYQYARPDEWSYSEVLKPGDILRDGEVIGNAPA